jgi:hypothetical protein
MSTLAFTEVAEMVTRKPGSGKPSGLPWLGVTKFLLLVFLVVVCYLLAQSMVHHHFFSGGAQDYRSTQPRP